MPIQQKQEKWAITQDSSMPFPETPSIRSICGCDNCCYDTLNLLLQDWPAIEKYIKELTMWFTTYIDHEGEPMIHDIIRSGLESYAKELYDQNSDRMPHRRVFAYIKCSLDRAAQLAAFSVATKSKRENWDVLSESPFSIWRLGKSELSIQGNSSLEHDVLLMELYKKLLPQSIKKVFWRYNYEEVFVGDGSGCST